MDPMRNGSSPPDNGLAKRLFSNSPQQRKGHDPSPSDSSTKRGPLRTAAGGKDSPVPGASIRKPRLGFCGGLIFLSLCLAAMVVTVHFNSWEWHRVTSKDLYRFFSNKPLHKDSQGLFGRRLFGMGALQLSLILGISCAIFTCVFTFYDSNVPGNFPPTPVSPRRESGSTEASISSNWHLGYIFVLINCLTAFSLALFVLRWNLGLPIL